LPGGRGRKPPESASPSPLPHLSELILLGLSHLAHLLLLGLVRGSCRGRAFLLSPSLILALKSAYEDLRSLSVASVLVCEAKHYCPVLNVVLEVNRLIILS
jgi:hypothetical protein